MIVHDGVFDESFRSTFADWLFTEPILFGWKTKANEPGKLWHRNYVLPGVNKHHYQEGAYRPELSFANLMQQRTPMSNAAKHISDTFFGGSELTRVWANVQTFGDESHIHRDYPVEFRGRAKTVVWYPMSEWHYDWGGDIVEMSDDHEIVSSVVTKSNRCVEFDGTALHGCRPISRYCPVTRIAVVFGAEL